MYIYLERGYEIAGVGNIEAKGENEVLAVYTNGAELSKFQSACQQPNERHKVREFESAVRNFGMYAQRSVCRFFRRGKRARKTIEIFAYKKTP